MKVGLTLEQLGQELVCQSEVKQDYLVSSDKMMMETYGGIPVLRVLDSAGEDCMEPLELNSTAHRQLSGYLRIPANYYERMAQGIPGAPVHKVNSWSAARGSQDAEHAGRHGPAICATATGVW